MMNFPKAFFETQSAAVPTLEKYDPYDATVTIRTSAGCFLELEDEARTQVFAYASYQVGDCVKVSIHRLFTNGKCPEVKVESVRAYASDLEYAA